jgi:hypothetical protein
MTWRRVSSSGAIAAAVRASVNAIGRPPGRATRRRRSSFATTYDEDRARKGLGPSPFRAALEACHRGERLLAFATKANAVFEHLCLMRDPVPSHAPTSMTSRSSTPRRLICRGITRVMARPDGHAGSGFCRSHSNAACSFSRTESSPGTDTTKARANRSVVCSLCCLRKSRG